MMRLAAFLILVFLPCGFLAQTNLVANPSFELYNHLPENPGDAKGSMLNWMVPVDHGGGDYYHANSKNKDCQTAQNYFGGEKPHSGQAYAGFCATPTYREFLATKLLGTLEKGKQYRITFFISKGDKSWLGNLKEMGVLFMRRQTVVPFGVPMNLPPQILFYEEKGFTQHEGWQELSATYTADGTEQWMIIGAHEWKCDTCKTIPGTARKGNPEVVGVIKDAHYYVDDVSVVEISNDTAVAVPVGIAQSIEDTSSFVAGLLYSFDNLNFANNSAVLEKGEQPDLEKILSYLEKNPDVTVTIFGYTDDVGDETDNYNLSLARAQAVKTYLVENGIEETRISAEGFGELRPVAPNTTPEGRALNRRVEFFFEK